MGDATVLERIIDRVQDPTNLSLALLKDITGDFSEGRKIGQGGFGEVYKGVLGEKIVAVKRFRMNVYTFDDKIFHREVTSLMKINHRNVVRFLGVCSEGHQKPIEEVGSGKLIWANILERLLCFEYISNGSLDKNITDELRGLEWETRYEIITGICKGLRYLHEEKNIIHMDLKPENILLDHQDGKYMVPKITDFGLSRPDKNSHTVGLCFGTLGYLAPEYREGSKTTPACDIYSLGVIIIELVTGCKDIPDEKKVLRRWRHRWNKQPTQLQYQQVTRCIYIAELCRKQKPEVRPCISKIISFLDESESTYGQISPCLDEDDMLRINPLELRLPSKLKDDIPCSVELTNGTRNCIAFNIQLPSAQYNTQPVKGIVQPGSTYVVTITVQARDVHDYNQVDKFIVQSRPVEASEGLIDEHITECMFRAEGGKVVDEVNLMVVYEPVKPQKNSRSREHTNMPAEEVAEAKKRKNVESAFEKGKNKLGTSEKAEVASMDINSSARGQSIDQTKQCKFYPPQSFSRHYPTNTIYLGEERHRAVDVARGAMGSLLDKLGKLVTEDYNLEKRVKTDIESFSVHLTNMHRDLPELENVKGAKILVNEVRELSYNIEDMVDSLLVNVEPNSSRSGFKEIMHETVRLLENGMTTHHQIGDVIRDIKDTVQAVADKKKKYNIDVKNVVANATTKAAIDLRISAIYEEDKAQLIGIEEPRDKIIRLLKEDASVPTEKLRVVSIVGMGGLGKTTLAKAVYDELKAYHPKPFVSVGQNPIVETVLKNIISEIKNDFNAEKLILGQLIKKLKELLENKRYLIVIDDIWDSSAWGVIKSAFPRNNHGSRVIITTRNHDVAFACCHPESKYVYEIKPLSDEDSRTLLFRRTFGSRKDYHVTHREEEISKYILKRCGGMPLAINSIASLLAGKVESTWEYVRKSLDAMTEGDDLEIMKQILDLSYRHLPDYLKTCLLYVCMYPEDREIEKNNLLRQWVAEGFVSANGRLDAVDIAEEYFKKLINMCMIQPGKMDYNNEVLSCRVHDIILDLLRSKSSKENFIQVIDGLKDEAGARGEIRRISVHYNDKEDSSILATIKGSLEHVRSVLLYRASLVPYFVVFKYIRVLHIENEGYFVDLTGISGLFLLRYLKVIGAGYELKLPDHIGELQQLETIDLEGGELGNYPSDIVSLPRLSHLRYSRQDGIALPDGIDRLKSLHTLEGVCVYTSSVENIKSLRELTNLRNLKICVRLLYHKLLEGAAMREDALYSSISRLSTSLKILTFGYNLGNQMLLYFTSWSERLFLPPAGASHIRELNMHQCEFESFPKWIGQLHHLNSLTITVCEVAGGLTAVGGLPSLAYFELSNYSTKDEESSVVISGGRAFKSLKHLIFNCQRVSLIFEEGALPKLEKLEIGFRYHMTQRFLPVGIEHLPAGSLKEVSLYVGMTELEVEGPQSQEDSDDDMDCSDYFGPDEHARQHKITVRSLLMTAFMAHHPSADILVTFEDCHGPYDEEEYANNGSQT